MDITNPVLNLCYQGIQAEAKGDDALARALYEQAWEQRKSDYEACVAAHYMARRQGTYEDMLRWNLLSLAHAEAVDDSSVSGFYPSLYLNTGKAHEMLGNREEAREYYMLASERVGELPPGPYADMVTQGIEAGLLRIISPDAATTS